MILRILAAILLLILLDMAWEARKSMRQGKNFIDSITDKIGRDIPRNESPIELLTADPSDQRATAESVGAPAVSLPAVGGSEDRPAPQISTPVKRAVVDSVSGIQVSGSTIIMLTAPFTCPPCEVWKRTWEPKFERQGWTVTHSQPMELERYPSFRVYVNGTWFSHAGQLTGDDVRRMLETSEN